MDALEKTVSDFMSDPECAGLFAPEDAGRLKSFVRWIGRSRMFDAELDMFGVPLGVGAAAERAPAAEKEEDHEECERHDGGGEAAENREG